jgi:hypothetical protein
MWPQHCVKALVRDVAEPIDIVGKPREPAGEGGGDHVERGRGVDHRAHRGRQFVRVGDGGVGDEQEPLNRRSGFVRVQGSGPSVLASHDWLLR